MITLGIIGIIAALTIPQLVENYKGKILHTQLEKAYSVLSQAIQQMIADEGQLATATNYPSYKFTPVFRKYFKLYSDCGGNKKGCEDMININPNENEDNFLKIKNYKTYTKKQNIKTAYFDDGQFINADGMFVMVENVGTSLLFITIDVNGQKNLPNAWGHDLFTFQVISNGKLLPMGAVGTYFTQTKYCSPTSNNEQNGIACTEKALNEPDYFKNLPK